VSPCVTISDLFICLHFSAKNLISVAECLVSTSIVTIEFICSIQKTYVCMHVCMYVHDDNCLEDNSEDY